MQKTENYDIGKILSLLTISIMLLSIIYVLAHNINTNTDIRNYRIDQLESLNHPTTNIERAQFKQLEKCVLNDYSSYENSRIGKFLIDFSETKAKESFNNTVNRCLTEMVNESLYQNQVLTNIDSVRASISYIKEQKLN